MAGACCNFHDAADRQFTAARAQELQAYRNGRVGPTTEEALRRGRTDDVRVVHGDLVQVSNELPAADLVTLDRVVCCYPSCELLLTDALRHAVRLHRPGRRATRP